MLSFIATDLQLCQIFKITRVLFFWDTIGHFSFCISLSLSEIAKRNR